MKARAQWVCWRYTWKPATENRPGKWDKPPIDARTGKCASSTDTETWNTFEDALAAYCDPGNGNDGIGYAFSGDEDDFVGVDLDDCRESQSGQILQWTPEQRACEHWAKDAPDPQQIIESLPTYAEVSPSLTGVKLFVRRHIPKAMKHGCLEMYSRGRYFTVTGHKLESAPSRVTDCNEALNAIYPKFNAKNETKRKPNASEANGRPTTATSAPTNSAIPTLDQVLAGCENSANGHKFRRLFGGDTSGYPSQSEAELALCGIVAFWSAGQASLIDAVYRQSKLCREKWDEKRGEQTYGQRTITAALDRCTDYYDWSRMREKQGESFSIGEVTLALKDVRWTPTKCIATCEVRKAGQAVDRISLSDAVSGRKQAVKSILARIEAPSDSTATEVDQVLGAILVKAGETKHQRGAGSTIFTILSDHIRPAIGLQYRTMGGKAFSEPLGQEFNLSHFVERFRSNDIIELASQARDAPKDDRGEVNRQRLIARVEQELRVLWSELLRDLPTLAQAQIPPDSPAAIAFRQAIIHLFNRPASMAITEHPVSKTKTVQLANRTSLASRVRRLQSRDEAVQCHGRWIEIQEGYKAYYREHIGPDGEVIPLLAIRFELAGQIGVTIPDVVDQTSLRVLGEKFCAIDPAPPVKSRLSGGGRLAVLSRKLTEQILAEPMEDEESGAHESSDASHVASCHSSSLAVSDGRDQPGRWGKRKAGSDAEGTVTSSLSDAVTVGEPPPKNYTAEEDHDLDHRQ